MKEQLPPPEFNTGQYLRAGQRWVCGRAKEGRACHIGPTVDGLCRATSECSPLMETKEGETKGRYRCTRLKEFGGPCEPGPLPDGACSQRIPPCQPVRSLRIKRGYLASSIVALTVGVLLLALYGPFRWSFISPGEISSHHTGAAFAKKMKEAGTAGNGNCAGCHSAGQSGPAGWLQAAFSAEPGPFQFQRLYHASKTEMTEIDQSCQHCHEKHNFHEPNVVREMSCSLCHREHAGSTPMQRPERANCASCHANASVMEASFQLGKAMPLEGFDFRQPLSGVIFKAPRPERGYTKVFESFLDHPEFQFLAQNLKEPNTLRFNHQRHFADDIAAMNKKKLDCVECHRPDTAGAYHLKISFEANCRRCHALQFDVYNPDLSLPHGNTVAVRAFLRSLPTQYEDIAVRTKRATGKRNLGEFVNQQMRQIHDQYPSGGEFLEQQMFYNSEYKGPVANVGGLGSEGVARYSGCAHCHEVQRGSDEVPAVTKPVIPDRWLTRGKFDHAKHFFKPGNNGCLECHAVSRSKDTADILLPSQTSCVKCHSPQGGVAHTCATCHGYHTTDRKEFSNQAAKTK